LPRGRDGAVVPSRRSGGFAIRPTVVSRRETHSIGSASALKP
jgi:hypothetical protein